MNHCDKYRVVPGSQVRLADIDPRAIEDGLTKEAARAELAGLRQRLRELQHRLYAEQKRSLLICLQAPDAGGKDGVVRHVFSGMNPQGCRVASFKQPTAEELAHNFLWRIERETPRRGEVAIFNRSHYEDVLIVRVRNLVPPEVWSQRYEQINEFERRLASSGTRVLKFFLHISKHAQLRRFRQRLEDPERQWKISEADYAERRFWPDYQAAYEAVFAKCSTEEAPWFAIPSDRKWYRNLAVSRILVEEMERLDIQIPKPSVDIDAIREKYFQAVRRSEAGKQR